MTNQRNRPDSGAERDRETLTGPPRWVKISAIVAGILILLVIAAMLLTGGQHGPARHGFGIGAPISPPAAAQSQPDPLVFRHNGGQM
jgi:hypothetical protein